MIRKVVCLCAINRVDNNPMQQEHISMSTGTHGWQFDRKVNVANLVLIAGLLLGGISWINQLDQRVTANSINIHHLTDAQERNWQLNKDARDEIKAQLQQIDDKLDRLLQP